MAAIELLVYYFYWHYTIALGDLFLIWRDLVWFLWNYFSIKQLVSTFLVPWKRIREENPSIFEAFELFSSIVITLLMRIIGVVIRSAVIVVGMLFIALAVFSGLLSLVAWIFMPVISLIIFVVIYEIKPV